MNKQLSLSALNNELAQAKTRKKELLEQMDAIISWKEWIGIIQPYYYKGETGDKPFPLETMLRIHMLQNLYDLSDMGAKYQVIDSRAFSEFCGVESSNQVPDGDTIGRFRALLVEYDLQERLFGQVLALLQASGLILKKVQLWIPLLYPRRLRRKTVKRNVPRMPARRRRATLGISVTRLIST